MKYDFIIIGGGMSGLVCAYILSKEGKKVIVLEKKKQTLAYCDIFVDIPYFQKSSRIWFIYTSKFFFVEGIWIKMDIVVYIQYFVKKVRKKKGLFGAVTAVDKAHIMQYLDLLSIIIYGHYMSFF